MTSASKMSHTEILRVKLEMMRREHRELDASIHALHETARADLLTLQRLKRRKLGLKDQIARILGELTPDIIA